MDVSIIVCRIAR
jgi:NADPH:quinone reductase-like Zn-dependent oxidoreductase